MKGISFTKRVVLTLICAIVFSVSVFAQTNLKKVYNEEINPMVQIDQALDKAKKEQKFVICQVGGNWCIWCLRFADFIEKDADITKMIDENFVFIHVNYKPGKKQDNEKAAQEQQMMSRLGNPGRSGYPVFVVLNEEGKVIHTQDSSFLEEGPGYNKDKVLRFFRNWTPTAVKGKA